MTDLAPWVPDADCETHEWRSATGETIRFVTRTEAEQRMMPPVTLHTIRVPQAQGGRFRGARHDERLARGGGDLDGGGAHERPLHDGGRRAVHRHLRGEQLAVGLEGPERDQRGPAAPGDVGDPDQVPRDEGDLADPPPAASRLDPADVQPAAAVAAREAVLLTTTVDVPHAGRP